MGSRMPRARVKNPLADPVRLAMLRSTGLLKHAARGRLERNWPGYAQGPQGAGRHGVAARRPPPPRQELRRAAELAKAGARAGHRFLLPARRHSRRPRKPSSTTRASTSSRATSRSSSRGGARLRRRPRSVLSGGFVIGALSVTDSKPRLEAERDRAPPRPRGLGADRDRDAPGHRGAQAGRDRAAALEGPPARADGQHPDG